MQRYLIKWILLFSFLFSVSSYSKSGFIEAYSSLKSRNKTYIDSLYDITLMNPKFASDIGKNDKLKIQNDILKDIFVNNSLETLNLLLLNECNFFNFLNNSILKTSKKNQKQILLRNQNKKTFLLSPLDIVKNFYPDCKKIEGYQSKFLSKNIKKTFKNDIKIEPPTSYKECVSSIEKIKKSPLVGNLCKKSLVVEKSYEGKNLLSKFENITPAKRKKIESVIIEAEEYLKFSPKNKRDFIAKVCLSEFNSKIICSEFESKVSRVTLKNSDYKIESIKKVCKEIVSNKNKLKVDVENCIKRLIANDKKCHHNSVSKGGNTLSPSSSCNDLILSYEKTKYIGDIKECPQRTKDENIILFSRVFNHFKKKKDKDLNDSQVENYNDYCFTNPINNLIKDLNNDQMKNVWKYKICIKNKVNGNLECDPFFYGDHPNSEFSEKKVLTSKIIKHYTAPGQLDCKIIDSLDYKPKFLKFRTGCYITYNRLKCSVLNCKKKIYYNGKLLKDFTYEEGFNGEFFHNSFKDKNYSLREILKKKFNYKEKVIRNLTELKYIEKSKNDVIYYGIACLENLMPRFFSNHILGSCYQVPFMATGMVKKEKGNYLVTHLPFDHISKPRLIYWNNIYSGLKSAELHRTLKDWNFYAVW